MKQQLALLIMAAIAGVSCNSQDIAPEKVPAVVVNTLKAQFPNAIDTEWEKKDAIYEADFDTETGAEMTVQIDASGKILMQKQDIQFSDLVAGIQNILQAQYKDFKVDEVEKVERGAVVFYQVELDGKGMKSLLKDKQLVFTADGREAAGTPFWN